MFLRGLHHENISFINRIHSIQPYVYFGWDLLCAEKISGGEFVTLIIAFAVLGLIISFSSEVQEFSVAGNVVKLKEVKKEADKSIQDLKNARVGNFKFLLKLAARFPGGFASGKH